MESSMVANDTGTMAANKDNSVVVSMLDDENLKQQSYLVQNSTIQCHVHAKCPPIDIEFVDLTYTVPVSRHGEYTCLYSVSSAS